MKRLAPFAVWTALACSAVAVRAQCPPTAWPLPELQRLKSGNWKIPDGARAQALALALLSCLGDANPTMRDGMAFEAVSTLLRGKQLTAATQRAIYQSQLLQLSPSAPDPVGFAKPFAALVLSEVARADRLDPFLSVDERGALLTAGTQYLRSIDDYRGFSTDEGWRHAVAHAADLMLQLVLNPAIDTPQLERIVLAVQSQVAPPGQHFYIYGEADRLARPVIHAARRGLLDAGFWSGYIGTLASPAPLASWDDVFTSQSGLARLHNVRSFLRALDAGVRTNPEPLVHTAFDTALPLALKELP